MSNFEEPVVSEAALEARARRAAIRCGLRAIKSRWRKESWDNQGGFALVNESNYCVGGAQYDMSAEEVIEYCKQKSTTTSA